jgi:hypothetical protein
MKTTENLVEKRKQEEDFYWWGKGEEDDLVTLSTCLTCLVKCVSQSLKTHRVIHMEEEASRRRRALRKAGKTTRFFSHYIHCPFGPSRFSDLQGDGLRREAAEGSGPNASSGRLQS